MASSIRALPRRLGQLAVHSRLSSVQPRLSLSRSWVCRQCAHTVGVSGQKARAFSGTPSARDTDNKADKKTDDAEADGPSEPRQLLSFPSTDTFPRRHIGPDDKDTAEMLKALSPPVEDLDSFVSQVIPADILSMPVLNIDDRINNGFSESELNEHVIYLRRQLVRATCFIGKGYYGTHTPAVIKRNVLENPAWYTSYTPYQPEISQGRLECLLNFQTMVSDLTGLPIANSSLLDEGTAGAEAMTLSMNALSSARAKREGKTYVVSDSLHPQTIAVLHGRAKGFGIRILPLDLTQPSSHDEIKALGEDLVGVMVQYPDTYGQVDNHQGLADLVHEQGALLSVAADLLALTLLKPPGSWGADIAFGSAQRFGVPVGFGGPHAAFFAVQEKYKRKIPGRLVGLSKDRLGGKAYRLALQTREQHIRREKATSNVCTAQALLANMSALYAIYHGPEGLKAIAERTVNLARIVQATATDYGYSVRPSRNTENGQVLFDTVVLDFPNTKGRETLCILANSRKINLRRIGATSVGISVDETTTIGNILRLMSLLKKAGPKHLTDRKDLAETLFSRYSGPLELPEAFKRTTGFLEHPVFNTHHSETEMLRYIHHLQSKDLSLVHSMIPLGSCTMKLNGTTEMELISMPEFNAVHPDTPRKDAEGYNKLLTGLKRQLASITGMSATSIQPNSGAQGEFAGLRAISDYQEKNSSGDKKRDICLIPVSAHGTNPASAAMAGMRVVPIKCDIKTGNLDLADLEAKCVQYKDELAAIMITYPSTYGIFEPEVRKVCDLVHEYGGQVYMDGANMNAQIGLCSPGDIGADVCHLNLHKTFCIPHGGGGPGVGPICVKEHLAEYLPSDPYSTLSTAREESRKVAHPVSSARYGSASISLISWAYNAMMGDSGLRHATKVTLLNANYLMSRLRPHYEILYTNEHGRCAHEFILDARPFQKTAGVEVIDIAKRLQDYGFHSPTMSFPVAGTLMIEPTESESREELDRFVDALVAIRQEIRDVEEGRVPRERNVLKMAPHPVRDLVEGDDGQGSWDRPYTREKAAFPLPWLKEKKFWPSTARVDDAYGDMNLFCTCPPVEDTTAEN